ncbi:2-iminobutanoate/2-iminopropanoate deaminase-like [Saccoglossus kowalevskii]|uniref:Ribonuclease UK114-like n=1 Tax=Saccoglossus kowalevskii TaxID=10224 RepID=A0ABM0GUF6_SACKO|nr:PREDICTED: ribonuclease UK114-like [Saccoglossus kowalevskii]
MAGTVRKILEAPKTLRSIPISAAVVVDKTMYISGQIGQDSTGKLVSSDIKDQTHQVLRNMRDILKRHGCDYSNVVKTTVFMADIKEFAQVNEVYRKYFPSDFPARSAFQVSVLPMNARVEIEAIAIVGPIVDAAAIQSKL